MTLEYCLLTAKKIMLFFILFVSSYSYARILKLSDKNPSTSNTNRPYLYIYFVFPRPLILITIRVFSLFILYVFRHTRTNSRSSRQKINIISRNTLVHYRVHDSSQVDNNVCQMNPINTLKYHFPIKILFSVYI
jgi:predicted CDP-diglyceride synthetase/phosphatidate cytidylyltransferase